MLVQQLTDGLRALTLLTRPQMALTAILALLVVGWLTLGGARRAERPAAWAVPLDPSR